MWGVPSKGYKHYLMDFLLQQGVSIVIPLEHSIMAGLRSSNVKLISTPTLAGNTLNMYHITPRSPLMFHYLTPILALC